MAATFPSDWRDQPCVIAAVPLPLAPYVGGLLKILENRGFWADETSFSDGYTAVTEVQECLMSSCLQDLIESNHQVYRLLDTVFNGQLYSATGDTPDTITPAIPLFPARGIIADDSMMGRSQITIEALDSFIAGMDTPHYSGTPNVHALLQAILDALSTSDTDLSDVIAKLEIIAGLLA